MKVVTNKIFSYFDVINPELKNHINKFSLDKFLDENIIDQVSDEHFVILEIKSKYLNRIEEIYKILEKLKEKNTIVYIITDIPDQKIKTKLKNYSSLFSMYPLTKKEFKENFLKMIQIYYQRKELERKVEIFKKIVTELIKEHLAEKNISFEEFCKTLNMDEKTFYKNLYKDNKINIRFIINILENLGYELDLKLIPKN